MLTPLHVKSAYSLGVGTSMVDDLVRTASDLGYSTLALTDTGNLYGLVQFHHLCRKSGIHPICGVELQVQGSPGGQPNHGRRLVLLAMDGTGYGHLCCIVSALRRGLPNRKKDAIQLAVSHGEGLVALTDDCSALQELVMSGRFRKDRLGLLLVRPMPDEGESALIKAARHLGVPLVADLDVVFLRAEDYPLHLLQEAISQRVSYQQMEMADSGRSRERWLRSPAEAVALFADHPEALQSASRIAGMCRFDLETIVVQPGKRREALEEDAAGRLHQLCSTAVGERSGSLPPWDGDRQERLDRELHLFRTLGFAGYMVRIAEILAYCRNKGIPVFIRGSGVSSLTLHLVGNTPVDPIAHGLLFERFLHAEKSAWPDVDLDLPWDRRDEVIGWVYQRYGPERVAMVGACHTFRYRSALREGLKSWGATPAFIERLSALLPSEDLAVEEVDFLGVVEAVNEAGFSAGIRGPGNLFALPEILGLVGRLVGLPRYLAAHPGGIVIADAPLADSVPLELAAKGVVITQYDLVAVARLGLIKIDLLGNRCLAELSETFLLLPGRKPRSLQGIPLDDRRTLRLIDRADTIGCFQLESPAMRSLLARIPIRTLADVVASLALIRPGAAAGAVKGSYTRRARGEEPAGSCFQGMEDRLAQTHGLFLYEEDIMLLLSRIGGIDLAQADELRRAIVRSGGNKSLLAELEVGFLGEASLHGRNGKIARQAWQMAEKFAAYSFNKAHAASYGVLAYYAAYAKANFPVQFACAVINHHQGHYPLRTLAADFSRSGVRIVCPHVNDSARAATCEKDAHGLVVRVGLDRIKGLTRRTSARIVEERAAHGRFLTLPGFLDRVRPSQGELAPLILAGACDGLAPLLADRYPFAHEAVVQWLREGGSTAVLDRLPIPHPAQEDRGLQLYRSLVRVKHELRYLEMHLSAHPLALLRDEAGRQGCVPITRAKQGGAFYRLAVLVAAMRRVPSGRGIIQFVSLEDETGLLEGVVLPGVFDNTGNRFTTPGPFLIEGQLRAEQGSRHLEVIRILPFHQRKSPYSGLA